MHEYMDILYWVHGYITVNTYIYKYMGSCILLLHSQISYCFNWCWCFVGKCRNPKLKCSWYKFDDCTTFDSETFRMHMLLRIVVPMWTLVVFVFKIELPCILEFANMWNIIKISLVLNIFLWNRIQGNDDDNHEH